MSTSSPWQGSTHENSTDWRKHTSENDPQEQSHVLHDAAHTVKDSLRAFNSTAARTAALERAAARITFCLHLNASSQFWSCTVTLPKGKTEHKTQSRPCCSHYSSPTVCEKFPTFNKPIPAEFYCLQLLIKHALKESKSLKSFASTKQLPY